MAANKRIDLIDAVRGFIMHRWGHAHVECSTGGQGGSGRRGGSSGGALDDEQGGGEQDSSDLHQEAQSPSPASVRRAAACRRYDG